MSVKAKATPARRRAPRPAAVPAPLDGLREALRALEPVGDLAGLSLRVVQVATQAGLLGARLWRLSDEELIVWEEAGRPGQANLEFARQVLEQGAQSTGPHHWACALIGGNERLGVLEVWGTEELGPQAPQVMELYARFARLALAHREQSRTIEELSSIVQASMVLNSTLDLGELINIILQLATRQTQAERGTVFLVDNEREEIWSLLGLGLEQHEIRLPFSRGIAGWVAKHGEKVNLRDVYEDPRFEPEVDRRLGFRTRSVLCLPIRNARSEVIGVLQLLNRRHGPFTSSDEGFLEAISDHVALALENARLHREALTKEKMERDLALARGIQRHLLPEKPPELEGFDIAVSHRASQMVGGDYYDFILLNPETLLFVIADVEGKGVVSALVMSNLQATLRALTLHVHSLERIVGSVNDMILADTRAQKYMSMFVGLLDQRHRVLHYINAGHVQPPVIRSNGETLYLTEGGMVVGLFPGVPFERGFVKLQSGDIVVSCTDGITEAMNAREDEYGNERLAEFVRSVSSEPAEKIVAAVLDDVDRFSRGGAHEDDRIIFILKVL